MSEFEEREHIEATRAEKILAFGLVVFLLIGGFWVFGWLGRIPQRPDYQAIAEKHGLRALEEETAALRREREYLDGELSEARAAYLNAQSEYQYRREEYRTALDRGVDDPVLKERYDRARETLEQAEVKMEAAQTLLEKKDEQLSGPESRLREAQERANREYSDQRSRFERQVFLLRLAYVLPLFLIILFYWQRLRKNGSRYTVIGDAFMLFATIQTIYLVGSYMWTLFRDFSQLVVSVVGASASIYGLIALKRHFFSFHRLSQARLRRGRCPYCDFPVEPGARYCSGCGQEVRGTCPSCGNLKFLLLPACPHCGSKSD